LSSATGSSPAASGATGRIDQAAELARLTGLHSAFGQAIDLQGGGYGLAVLSRFRLKDVKTDALPGKAGQEARVVMRATVEPGGGWPAVTVLNTHLQHDDGPTRETQAAKLNDLFGVAEGAFVLAGDLNAAPDSRQRLGLRRVERVSHAQVERPRDHRHPLRLRVRVRRDLVPVRHLDPEHERTGLRRVALEDGDPGPRRQRQRPVRPPTGSF